MVKLTVDLIVKLSIGTTNKKRPDETVTQFLNRITHLYFQDKSIDEIVITLSSFFQFQILKNYFY
jgi:protein phosphatase 1 regulatory subunit 42